MSEDSPIQTALAIVPATAPSQLATRNPQLDRDQQVIQLWIDSKRSPHTRRAYRADVDLFFKFSNPTPQTPNPALREISLRALLDFSSHLESSGRSAAAQRRILAAIKSLFTFASQDGIRATKFNVAAALQLPIPKQRRNERTLSEEQVEQLIAAAKPGRDRLLIELCYRIGARIDEVVSLKWSDAQADRDGGVITLFGKGEKTRAVHLEKDDWEWLVNQRPEACDDDAPLVASACCARGSLSTVQAWRIISTTAKRAGLKAGVSPHWLRHAHATHALDHGADIRMVQQSLGHASVATTETYVHSRPRKSSGAFLKRRAEINRGDAEDAENSTRSG